MIMIGVSRNMKKKAEQISNNILYWNILLISIIIVSVILIGWRMTSLAKPITEAPESFEGVTQNRKDDTISGPNNDVKEPLDFSGGVVSSRTQWYKAPDFSKGDWYDLTLAQITEQGIIPSYCLQHGNKNINGNTMVKSDELGLGYVALIQNGWPNKSITGENEKDYYITQVAIWMYITEHALDSKDFLLTSDQVNYFNTSQDAVSVQIRRLVKLANEAQKVDTTLRLSVANNDTKLHLTSDKKYYESQLISVSHSDALTSYTVSDLNGPSGIKIVDANGNDKTTFGKGDKFKVRIPAASITDTSKTASLQVTGAFTEYHAFRYTPEGGVTAAQTAMPAILWEKEITNKSVALSLDTETARMGFVKVDDKTGEMVKGAKLEVQKLDGTVIASWTTDGSVHYVDNMILGNYVLVETEAPEGYVRNPEKKSFTAAPNVVEAIKITNATTKLEVLKLDEATKKPIAGATLVIKDAKGTEVYRFVTTEKPHVISKIPVGNYTIEEVEAPEGYVLNPTPIAFSILADGKVQRVIMKQNYTKIKIVGHDVTVDTTLVGVTFQIKDSALKEVPNGKWTTSASKLTHTIKGLKEGVYTLHEVDVPDGYVKNEEPAQFEITGGDLEVMVPNDFTKVRISKKDITNEEELPGATLQIKDAKGKVIEEWVSTEEEHEIDRLPVGKYTLIETITPEGYQESTSTVEFEVKETGEIQPVTFYNVPIVEVPDTASNVPIYVYILGGLIILSGTGLIYVNSKKKNQ